MTTARRLEYQLLDELQPAPINPKLHDDDDGIGASLDRFGYVEPMVLDERTGLLVVGHGRWENMLAKEAAGDVPPEGVSTDADGRWLVPVLRGWRSENDAHAEAYLLASNQLTVRGGWDLPTLAERLQALDEIDDELRQTAGWSTDDLADLLAHTRPPSLDDLADQHGDPDPSHLWPVLRFKVAPEVRDRYLRLIEGIEGSDADLFAHLVDLAERAPKARRR